MKKLAVISAVCTLLLAAIFTGCKKKDDISVSPGDVSISLSHMVDGVPLMWDSLLYTNNAGNQYSVSKLQYYLSGFRFYRNGQMIFNSDSVFYVDARRPADVLIIEGMPYLTYDSMAFYIGVDPAHNISNGLPATLENTAMVWPDAMGGGYHFLRLEGHWKDTGVQFPGFAMHIGNTDMLVHAGVVCHLNVKPNELAALKMTMNVNEWFRNPVVYNFSTDGVYSMGNMELMKKLADNGADVFKAN